MFLTIALGGLLLVSALVNVRLFKWGVRCSADLRESNRQLDMLRIDKAYFDAEKRWAHQNTDDAEESLTYLMALILAESRTPVP